MTQKTNYVWLTTKLQSWLKEQREEYRGLQIKAENEHAYSARLYYEAYADALWDVEKHLKGLEK